MATVEDITDGVLGGDNTAVERGSEAFSDGFEGDNALALGDGVAFEVEVFGAVSDEFLVVAKFGIVEVVVPPEGDTDIGLAFDVDIFVGEEGSGERFTGGDEDIWGV